MTTVVNLRTGKELVYDLKPEIAVAVAYRQQVLGDYNWWEERKGAPVPLVQFGKYTIACGDFCAFY